MTEVWKDINGYEGRYQVSNLGIVKRLSRTLVRNDLMKVQLNEFTLKPATTRKGYLRLSFESKGKHHSLMVHRIVATAFIPNPENKKEINHIDGNKKNNKVTNLEWCTSGENLKHAYKTGLRNNIGENNPSAKLKSKDVIKIKKLYSTGLKQVEIGRIMNLKPYTINRIVKNKHWSHV